MKRFQLAILMAMVFLFSCTNGGQPSETIDGADTLLTDTAAVLNSMKSNLNIQTNSFIQIDSSGIVMFPLSAGETARYDGSINYKEMPPNSYWNVIFYNSHTGNYHLLSERKMIVSSLDFNHSSRDYIDVVQTSKYIFYRVTIDDYNNDKKLSSEDPVYLFLSDKEGNNFKQISPANYNLRSWQMLASSNKLLMTLTNDNNNDKKFEGEDEVVTFEYTIGTDSEPKEVFSNSFKNKLKILYDRDWKRLKK